MNVMPISPTVCGAASGTRRGLMLEYQKSPNPGTACRAATVLPSRRNVKRRPARLEGGAATARFLVLQHERRRRAARGPRADRRLVGPVK